MSRRNGFTQHLNCEQAIALSAGLYLICVYFIIITPMLRKPLQIINSVICACLVLGIAISAGICTYIDPGENKESYKSIKFCTICNKNVVHTSKHCGQCNHCVAGFDHHCSWINNCIGTKNYKEFIIAIILLESFTILSLMSSIYVIYYSAHPNGTLDLIFDIELIYATNALSILLSSFFTGTNGILIVFHVYLNLKKISTYDFIISRRTRSSKVTNSSDLQRFYEPYVEASLSQSIKVSRAPKILKLYK